jgi:hypothetical protein
MNKPLRNLDLTTSALLNRDDVLSGASANLEFRESSSVLKDLVTAQMDRFASERKAERVAISTNRTQDARFDTLSSTAQAGASDEVQPFATPALGMATLTRPQASFSPLQEWEGYVVSLTDTRVIANLVDLTSEAARPGQQAEIPLEEFSDTDVEKLSEGSVFRWAIGYQRLPGGTKTRVSQIVVRDLPKWTANEVSEAKQRAAELFNFLNRGE